MTRSNWEVVIGLETHAQLKTNSKIFSGASIAFGAEPNVQACPVDLALPGTLPVLNQEAVNHAIRFGLAIGSKIAPISVFARKNYFYPDLPKGYQISQFALPVVIGGKIPIEIDGVKKEIQLTRAHLEEDAGKSLHDDFVGLHGEKSSGIDLNRAGTPLLEIVTDPVMRSAAEAVAYAKELHALVMWIGICDGNMQEGSFRCDANVSVRPLGQQEFGTRCEIKNLNSFKFLEEAIQYEVQRQIELIEDGGVVKQETRLYDPDRQETRSMRSKEDAQDYRYFPDPDLLPLHITEEMIASIRATMPALPSALRNTWQTSYGLSDYDASLLTQSKSTADYFIELLTLIKEDIVKPAVNLMSGDLASALNRDGLEASESPVRPSHLAQILQRIQDGTISNKIAKDIFATLWERGVSGALADQGVVDALIEEKGLKQISDVGAIEKIIDQVLSDNPKSVEEFRSGKEKAFNSLVGQIMKASKGKANPAQVNQILKEKLSN
ncbi:aspartyl/glutamyl-tRNA(Asn/Gln) amidotransferase subunit B [Polynucleobacter sp. SHI8]|uniref:Asp-tRNA(Asn)/Glu-tRNA(Gln) amidotransferase subunit GatB n=1 Tax=unclassified Polynucleobacter TaxID=2640945 RepID=UPI002491A19B|nr:MULTISPECIES: Asp-tRNA(Asn)/Glu-tRNA(Gln) amidotransferase subunit GatB [unclassified Polynucleobacter]BDW12233.1 aspartyl/glutamyl-tRNA(Asn/Gln) amidotransferase subunit B [Polynucleobacter sp. SHI2]BDW14681.1 aspartyl/glutamyl-tRNA(Asn/Gln) amidotransferase subunit B [Polynucleobacter sp. SHI8]